MCGRQQCFGCMYKKYHLIHITVCKACLLQVIDEDGCQEISRDVGSYFLLELAKLRDEYDVVGDVRGKGLMIGVELVADKV